MKKRPVLSPSKIKEFIEEVVGEDVHSKRVASLADATLGVLESGSLCIHAIGRGLAAARGLVDKHAVKQIDRLLSNLGIDVDEVQGRWVRFVLAQRKAVVVNMDWTEFDPDGHSMLVLSVQTNHGRSTPLLWKTHETGRLKGRRNDLEDALLARLRDVLPEEVKVTIAADRGFSDAKLYELLDRLGFAYVIRFRSNVHVTIDGETRKSKDWLGPGGRMRVLRQPTVTANRVQVGTVVCVQAPKMKEAWCLVASSTTASGRALVALYGKRFTIEEMFRDTKDMRFGMGLGWQHIGRTDRRDRLFLLAAFAHGLLTLLGAAGEAAGLDRLLKTNTVKTRTLSLFRQGIRWYELIPNMPADRLRVLVAAFREQVQLHDVFHELLGTI